MTNILINILSIMAGAVYLKSSGGKISNPYAFGKVVESYRVPIINKLTVPISILIGPLEMVLGFMIILNVFRSEALIISIFLQIVFISLMILRFNKNLPFGCGCFGLHAPDKITWPKLSFNVTYSLLLVIIFLMIDS
ncbi:MauE/DoxX family redox-associated membrane protein [Metabacillus fastidiosus]|uniref:MauE/DoxX family redox-associated membrane protein n=1 Tax=Metabacillus fastidiosus TaxID=1458 RepID=UPI002E233DE3|nr:MauE/DoxX family redox-associated membrane protein [Metabacillus fastidiosus]MED4534208.1 hypothetical protein [Metabacillus fastidiosus]